MFTVQQAIEQFGVGIDEHLDRQATIPVLAGLQFQGDVAVVPTERDAATTLVPPTGVAVVRGENGGNTHLLLAEGPVFFDPSSANARLDLGTLTVPEESTAFLAHPEHSYAGIAPGTYTLRRQREQADEIRLVAD